MKRITLYPLIALLAAVSLVACDKSGDETPEADFGTVQVDVSQTTARITVSSPRVVAEAAGRTIREVGVRYRAAGGSEWTDITAEKISADTYSALIENLAPGTRYDYLLYLATDANRYYGKMQSLTTDKVNGILGQWRLMQWHEMTELPFEVRMSFSDDGRFTLWQKLQSVEWQRFEGSYELAGTILSGKYDDGQAWSAGYDVAVDGNKMTWTNTSDGSDRAVYIRENIPDELQSLRTADTSRAISAERFL